MFGDGCWNCASDSTSVQTTPQVMTFSKDDGEADDHFMDDTLRVMTAKLDDTA
jgi:hypothetical protein